MPAKVSPVHYACSAPKLDSMPSARADGAVNFARSAALHRAPRDFSDHVAYGFTRLLRFFADAFFARRYGHRAVVLETVAAVPGMVGGTLRHLRSLRRMEGDRGWIHTLLEEAISCRPWG